MTNLVQTVLIPSLAPQFGDSPTKVTMLPFVKKIGKGKNRRICFWRPKRTGKFWEDAVIGQYYATEALQYMKDNDIDLLRFIARDMGEVKGVETLEMQFWRTISEYTRKGISS